MSRFFKSAAFPILIVVVLAFFAQKLISPGARTHVPNYSEFIAQVEPKTDPKGNPLAGSTINWKSIRPAGGKDEAEVEEETEADDEGVDGDEVPF